MSIDESSSVLIVSKSAKIASPLPLISSEVNSKKCYHKFIFISIFYFSRAWSIKNYGVDALCFKGFGKKYWAYSLFKKIPIVS